LRSVKAGAYFLSTTHEQDQAAYYYPLQIKWFLGLRRTPASFDAWLALLATAETGSTRILERSALINLWIGALFEC